MESTFEMAAAQKHTAWEAERQQLLAQIASMKQHQPATANVLYHLLACHGSQISEQDPMASAIPCVVRVTPA